MYPERTIDIYRAELDLNLPKANQTAYACCARYLRKLRPLYDAVGRSAEWTALVTSIREKYRNRPRFVEALENLDSGSIVQVARKRRG